MKVVEIKEKNIWNEFLFNSNNVNFLQSWDWGIFEESLKKKIFRLGIENEKGNLIGICLCVEEKTRFGNFIYCPRGPMLNWDNGFEVLECLINFFKNKKYFCIRFDPPIVKDCIDVVDVFKKLKFQNSIDFVQVERAWMLNIEGKSEDELMLGMRKKARYSLKQAMKSDIEVVRSDSLKDFKKFLDILEKISIKKNFPLYPREYLIKQFGIMGEYFKLFCAKEDGKIIAGGFFSFFKKESTYLRGATTDSSQASYLIQWEAIKYAKEMGIARHNFMGVAEEKNYHPGYPAFGYSNFKRGFGGYLEEYMRAQDYVYGFVPYKLLRGNQFYRRVKYRGCN